MSATLITIAKKIAVMILTDKRTWKFIGSIIAGVLTITLLPLMVMLSMGNQMEQIDGNMNYGTDYIQNLNASQREMFSQIETAGQTISDELTRLELKEKILEAQLIYLTYFNETDQSETFFKDFTGCFLSANSDKELINLINQSYNLQIDFDEYMRSVSLIRHITIDENLYVNLQVKNNIDLVKWAVNAFETGWGYVPNTFGEVLSSEKYKLLEENYPSEITDDCEKWFGRRTIDNLNLLKSYLVYDFEDRTISADNETVLSMTLQELYSSATKKGNMESLPQAVGTAVFDGNIIGIYIGNDEVIYAKSVNEGVVKEKISDGEWTSWFKIPNIQYGDEGSFSGEIDFSDYYNPNLKNNLDLAKWAVNACESGWGYVYGTYGIVLDEDFLQIKMVQYPNDVGGYEEIIRQNWLGKRTADCVGLIKGYSWYDAELNEIKIGSNGMTDIGADGMFGSAKVKGAIDTMPEVVGLAVWHEGHIGIYIGNGEVIEAMNTKKGVVKTNISDDSWTHWLQIPYISYVEEKE